MSDAAKKKVLMLAGFLVFVLLLLALSLPNLRFKEGEPFPVGSSPMAPGGAVEIGGGEILLLIFRGILALGLILLPVYIVINLLTPEGRRQLLAQLIVLGLFMLVALWLSQNVRQPEEAQVPQPTFEMAGEELPMGEMGNQAPPTFEPETQNWMVALTVVVVALILAAFLFILTRRLLKPKQPPGELEQLADRAQQAVRAIGLGMNFENVILQCYVEMVQTIEMSRGIYRRSEMTPLEFQQHLEKAGVPAEPVRKLTQLFDMVRYGHQPVSDQGKREAVESLNQIIAYCRSLG